jgi:lauroyl/myristoyl acyltransferase
VFWRKFVDWTVVTLPSWSHPLLLWLASLVFFFVAGPARRAVVRHLGLVLPGSSKLANHVRALRVFANFGWSLVDGTVHRFRRGEFTCELEGENFLQDLATAPRSIVLTAHLGNYNLGAALFAEKFRRSIHMVRAPEPDALAAKHLDATVHASAAGAVTIGYSSDGTSLAFDLLGALRQGDIICIQGDRLVADVARRPVRFFGREVLLPFGPFALAWASDTPIRPLFVVRTGHRRYKIIARAPIVCRGPRAERDQQLAHAMQEWSEVLEQVVSEHWAQWFAFTPIF